MIDRRNLLLSGTATAGLAALSATAMPSLARAATKAAAATSNPKLKALFESFVQDLFDHAPELVTSLGLDTGKRAHQRGELSPATMEEVERQKRDTAKKLAQLEAFDRKSLTGSDAVSYDVVHYSLKTQNEADQRYDFGGGGAGAPYVVSQLGGSYQQAPSFLDNQQPIENKADCEYYLSRMSAWGDLLDQENGLVKHDVGEGVVPPDFVLSRTLEQMKHLRGTPAGKSVMVESIVRRSKEKKIAGDWGTHVEKIVTDKVYPALDRQIALIESLKPKTNHDAGVWKLKDGEAYYADSITNWTTTNMKPADIHKLGLEIVADHTAKIDAIMKKNGLTKGTVGERLRAMYDDPKFRYPNTDAGKEKLIADLNEKVKAITAKLPKYFGTLPKAELVIKRVPKFIEAGAPGGSYNPGSLDGKRPAIYYINLRDTAEVPSWTLPTLTYHEGIPGHHLQLSLQQEAHLPMIRKLSFFSAYIEGWALYAEQLAVEMGMYEDDQWGHIGQLHDAMFRGVRLVVDTGIHAMKWSREKAIKYYVDALGDQEASATTEIERYCVWPGQACAYMLGKIRWLELRDKAEKELGGKFDIRKFHDAGLLSGAMPLDVLSDVMNGYIKTTKV